MQPLGHLEASQAGRLERKGAAVLAGLIINGDEALSLREPVELGAGVSGDPSMAASEYSTGTGALEDEGQGHPARDQPAEVPGLPR